MQLSAVTFNNLTSCNSAQVARGEKIKSDLNVDIKYYFLALIISTNTILSNQHIEGKSVSVTNMPI